MTDFWAQDGSSQTARVLNAMEDGYCNVYDLSFEDQLSMAADFSKLLSFYDLGDNAVGDWSALFESDEAAVMAMILATDLDYYREAFDAFLLAADDVTIEPRSELVPNYTLATQMVNWQRMLVNCESELGYRLADKFSGLEQAKLNAEMNDLLASYLAREKGAFGEWKANLKRNFHGFYNAIVLLKSSAKDILPESLQSQTHNPPMGLYIAFLRMFDKVQQRANKFTSAHRDFYYRELLGIKELPARSDSAYLVLRPDGSSKQILVPKETEFLATIGESKTNLVYSADHDLLVSDAEVKSLHTLYFSRDALSSPECILKAHCAGMPRQFITSAKINRIELGEKQTARPLFGAPKAGSGQVQSTDAEIGFAVASPVLYLKEGERTVSIKINTRIIEVEQIQDLNEYLADIARQLELEKFPKSSGFPRHELFLKDAFFKVFSEMFRVQFTIESGWYTVDEYLPLNDMVDKDCEAGSLNIQISLAASVVPIVGYSNEVHGGAYDTRYPVVRFILNSGAYLYPYSLLKDLQVESIDIEVSVKGAKDILMYNNLGQLSPDAPFNPFGPLPAVGSYFLVGNAEIAAKQLTGMDLDIEWGGLPTALAGFTQYYQNYAMDIDNASFQVDLSLLKNGQWIPQDQQLRPKTRLFDRTSENHGSSLGGLSKNRKLAFDAIVDLSEAGGVCDGFKYTSLSKHGFFKFTLSDPKFAFGHKEYPLKLAEALTSNTRRRFLKEPKPIPNPAYTPLINSIAMNYQAEVNINLSRRSSATAGEIKHRLIHIHPLGMEDLCGTGGGDIHLLPQYNDSGTLFIGLAARQLAQRLSLYFHLRADSLSNLDGASRSLQWSYLSSNQWKQISKSRLIDDSTRGFLNSGIVVLDIPEDINKANSIMPDDLYWLKISGNQGLDQVCSLCSVYAQGIKVSYQYSVASALHLRYPLPNSSIDSTAVSIPGIVSIEQIADSFGGANVESPQGLIVRTSERLKHKNRACTAWDYERLILQRYAEIYKVKCFCNLVDEERPDRRLRPGQVLIVVVSETENRGALDRQAMVNSLLLSDIKSYVESLASPFVSIKVRNPVYEKIQVRCAVKFAHGKNSGRYIKVLNRAIKNYLSPWTLIGYSAQFYWCIRRYDLESYIHDQEYIDYVTQFSMLQITQNDQKKFRLFDTVRDSGANAEVRGVYPWSIAVPVETHYIETTDDEKPLAPIKAGTGDLEIGSTLIISARGTHGEEK